MIIKKVYIGNKEEAFIEKRFIEGLNIIFSDDNNRGKTIVLQGLYYALGNDAIFPEGFEFKDYYFIVEISIASDELLICRNKNNFVVRFHDHIYIYNSVTEFKYFFDKYIYKLPRVLKDEQLKTTELGLFFQLFFIGQDDRISHNVVNHGYYNKDDFVNMIYAYSGIQNVRSDVDPIKVKEEIKTLGSRRDALIKENKFLKSNVPAARLAHYTLNKQEIEKKLGLLEVIKNEIIALQNERNRVWNKKIKNEILLKELNSLNTTLSEGEIVCLDCHSNNIAYKNQKNGIQFDVSNMDIRKSILDSVKEKIHMYIEDCSRIEQQLTLKQLKLKELLKDEDISLENLLLYKTDINETQDIDLQIQKLDNSIAKLQASLANIKVKNDNIEIQQKELMSQILSEISSFYNQVDPDGKKKFDNLFTIKGTTYSGSEGGLFYISRVYAYAKILKHSFPIVMDSFRDGEISSQKEDIILPLLKKLPNQIILSSTLKMEEFGKYRKFNYINGLDYSSHTPYHILNKKDMDEFKNVMDRLLIQL